jgi:tRNA(fMet)-specific endonuclease VapC
MTYKYLFDTNIVSHIMQGNDEKLLKSLAGVTVGQAAMSSISFAELEYGLCKHGKAAILRAALESILLRVDVLPWTQSVAACYGQLCSSLEKKGINLSNFDMMIAAHAVSMDAILVTRDKAFSKLGIRLKIEVW